MDSPREWAELQLAADHATVIRAVRNDGIASLIWGVLVAGAGPALTGSVLVTGVGLALIGSGIWQVVAPRPAGFLLSGTFIGLIGALNILGSLVALATGAAVLPTFLLLGGLQCVWAGRMFARHRRFAPGFGRRVDPAAAERAGAMLGALRAADPKSAPDVIEFTIGDLQPRRCRARLEVHGVLCVIGTGDDVRLLTRAQFHVERSGGVLLGSAARVRFRIGERLGSGTMPRASWERLERWQATTPSMALAA